MINRILFALIVALTAAPVIAQDNPLSDSESRVAIWHENKEAALSYTYDDTELEIPVWTGALDDYGVKGTFTGHNQTYRLSAPLLALQVAAYAAGHEIGSHTRYHDNLGEDCTVLSQTHIYYGHCNPTIPYLTEDDPDDPGAPHLAKRLTMYTEGQLWNEANITGGEKTVAISYPFGVHNAAIGAIALETHLAGRTTNWDGPNAQSPVDMSRLVEMGRCNGCTDEVYTALLLTHARDVVASQGWGIETFHDIQNPTLSLPPGYNDTAYVTENSFRNYLAEVTTAAEFDTLWIGTMGDVARYVHARDGTVLDTVCSGDETITISMTHSLDPVDFTRPITVLTKVPYTWDVADMTAEQNSVALDVFETSGMNGDSDNVAHKFVRIEGVMLTGSYDVVLTGPAGASCWPVFTTGPDC